MRRARLKKYAIFLGILVVGVALDQWSKWYASERLANGRLEDPHSITLRVPDSADGETLRSYLGREFSANDPDMIDRIAQHWVIGPDGQRLAPDARVRSDELLEVVHRKVTVIPGFFDFEYAENRGAAFSFLADSNSPYRLPILIGFSAIALVVIVYLLEGVRRDQHLMMIALSLVATGAAGNLIDRIRLGYVIDFVLWKWGSEYRWPNFNVADACISVGVVLMLGLIFFGSEHAREESGS